MVNFCVTLTAIPAVSHKTELLLAVQEKHESNVSTEMMG